MKTECLSPLRIALVVGTRTSVVLERTTKADGTHSFALPSCPLKHGLTLRDAAARLAKTASVGDITTAQVLAVIRGGFGDSLAAPETPISPITIAMTVAPSAAPMPLETMAGAAIGANAHAPSPAPSGTDTGAPTGANAGTSAAANDGTPPVEALQAGDEDPQALRYVMARVDALPLLEPWSNGVLNAARTGQRLLDIDGNYVPVGALPWVAGTATEGEPELEDFARTLRTRPARRGHLASGRESWLAGATMFAAGISWSTGVFGALSQPGQLGGRTAFLFWLMVLPVTWAIAVRTGFSRPASDWRSLAARSLLVGVGSVALLLVGALGLILDNDALAWMLVVLGIGGYSLTSWLTRARRTTRRDLPTRAVGGLVWATLVFTTVWVLSPGLRELVGGPHRAHPIAPSIEEGEEAD